MSLEAQDYSSPHSPQPALQEGHWAQGTWGIRECWLCPSPDLGWPALVSLVT